MLAGLFQATVLYFNYEINKDFITEEYCENKERPELQCNGQCHLAKQLKIAEQEKSNATDQKSERPSSFISFVFVLDQENSKYIPTELGIDYHDQKFDLTAGHPDELEFPPTC